MEETILELGKALKMPEHCICIMVGPGLEIRQDWKCVLDQDCDRDVKCTSFAKQQQASTLLHA
jgi:hypothetical protein